MLFFVFAPAVAELRPIEFFLLFAYFLPSDFSVTVGGVFSDYLSNRLTDLAEI